MGDVGTVTEAIRARHEGSSPATRARLSVFHDRNHLIHPLAVLDRLSGLQRVGEAAEFAGDNADALAVLRAGGFVRDLTGLGGIRYPAVTEAGATALLLWRDFTDDLIEPRNG